MSTISQSILTNGIVKEFLIPNAINPSTLNIYLDDVLESPNLYNIVGNNIIYIIAPSVGILKLIGETYNSSNTCNVNLLNEPLDINIISEPEDSNDMKKSVYDTNNDGIVNDSSLLDSKLPSFYLNRTNHIGDIDIEDVLNLEEELEKRSLDVGFSNLDNISMSFDDNTRTLNLNGIYDFHVNNGDIFNKTNDSFQWSDNEGLIYIYYDNNGVLQEVLNPNRNTQYETMISTLPVAYIYWDFDNKKAIFLTDILKSKQMAITTWVKQFYDHGIYNLDGLNILNDPSNGGTNTPNGSLDLSAQFSLSPSNLLFTDRKYPTNIRNVTSNYTCLYLLNNKLRSYVKTNFSVLTDIDTSVGASGRLVYNNDNNINVVDNNNFVWYFIGVGNNVDENDRIVSFMGQNQYNTINDSKTNLIDETILVEKSFSIRQEFTLTHAILFETSDTFTNSVKARIRDFRILENESVVSTSSGGGSVPSELVDGSETTLHNHPISSVTNLQTNLNSLDVRITNLENVSGISVDSTSVDKIIDLSNVITFIDATNNNITITLPSAIGNAGIRHNLKRIDNSSKIVTIINSNNELLEGSTQSVLPSIHNIQIISDGINWYII